MGTRTGAFSSITGFMAVGLAMTAAGAVSAAPTDTVQAVREIRTVHTAEFGVPHPHQLGYEATSGTFTVLEEDVAGPELLRLDAAGDPTGRGRPATRDLALADPGTADVVPLDALGERELTGAATDPATGLTYVGSPDEERIYALDGSGDVTQVYDYSSTEVAALRDLAVAPSSDATDDPATTSLYLADGGAGTQLGGITEVSLAVAPALTVEPVPAEVVQVVDTWAFDLASPDPSGVTWLPASDRLLVVDSEVDEVTGAGHTAADLWELTRQGAVTRSGDTWAYSIEPTGVCWGDGVLFITDDNNKALYVVRPGNDGAFGTPDDPWTELSTGLSDMEDPAYDAATGVLYFLNGIDREVHWIDPGSDDTFGTGDDTRGQFDVHVHGVDDAEALAFDPDRRTLLVGDRINERLFEITTDNQLVQVIDLSAAVSAGLQYVSGVTVAPHSSVAGASSYWVVDRGIDNSSSNLDENDGQLFEFARPSLTTPPTVTITEPEPWLNVLEGTPITFRATAVDVEDGTAPLTWRSDRDGALGTGTSVQATLSLGTHVVTATATDSDGQQGSDTITVYVTQPAGPWHVRRTVEASTDDAEEVLSSGSVTVSSSDLDLVEDRLSGSVMAPAAGRDPVPGRDRAGRGRGHRGVRAVRGGVLVLLGQRQPGDHG